MVKSDSKPFLPYPNAQEIKNPCVLTGCLHQQTDVSTITSFFFILDIEASSSIVQRMVKFREWAAQGISTMSTVSFSPAVWARAWRIVLFVGVDFRASSRNDIAESPSCLTTLLFVFYYHCSMCHSAMKLECSGKNTSHLVVLTFWRTHQLHSQHPPSVRMKQLSKQVPWLPCSLQIPPQGPSDKKCMALECIFTVHEMSCKI